MTRWISFTLVLFIVSGCSFQGLIYRNLDWIAMRRINQQFDLNREQRRIFEPDIRKLVNEVKVIAINGSIEFLNELHAATADQEFTEEEFLALEQKIPALFQQIMGLITADSARLLASLNAEQIQHFQNKLEESNDWLEDLTEAGDQTFPGELSKALEKSRERYTSWLGELSKQQVAMIGQFWPNSPDEAKAWRENRRQQQAAFVTILKESNERQVRQVFVQWAENPLWLKNKAGIAEDNRNFRNFIFKLRPTFRPEQVQHLHHKVGEVLTDLNSLQP